MSELASAVKKNAGLAMLLGVVMIILGVLALFTPLAAGGAVAIIVGLFLLVGGFSQFLFAFKVGIGHGGILLAVLGLLTMLAGIWMLARPLQGLLALTWFLALYFLISGVSGLIAGLQMKPIQGWGWTVFDGIVGIVLAVLIWRQWPVSGIWAIGILVGIRLIFGGWGLFALGSAARAVAGAVESNTV
jgi:uncharacterized membrane protein HdeD (DUF308 family)